jgi:Fur family transcriptional regulator, ferric uptake regulator
MEAATQLAASGLAATVNRELVVRVLSENGSPLTPLELLERLDGRMNRVTLYRILDLLVERGVVTRHNAGERAFRYCLSHGSHHESPLGHAHFHCSRCGRTQCLDEKTLRLDLGRLCAALPMRVEAAEFSLSGVCQGCLGAA